jgi:NosR/NirI family transcriptional regulator, nitrous oxide reductase regulator
MQVMGCLVLSGSFYYAEYYNICMVARLSFNGLLNFVVVLLLLLAVAIRGGASFKWLQPKQTPSVTLSDIKVVFSNADSFKQLSNGSLLIYGADKQRLGVVLVSDYFNASSHGYGGEVPLLIAVNTDGCIVGVMLLKNDESPEYLELIQHSNLTQRWIGLPMDNTILNYQVDGISGATFTSRAIIDTFYQTASAYLQVQYQRFNVGWVRLLEIGVWLFLMVASFLLMFGTRWRKYYFIYLLAVVLVFGVWLNRMLTLDKMNLWLLNGPIMAK